MGEDQQPEESNWAQYTRLRAEAWEREQRRRMPDRVLVLILTSGAVIGAAVGWAIAAWTHSTDISGLLKIWASELLGMLLLGRLGTSLWDHTHSIEAEPAETVS